MYCSLPGPLLGMWYTKKAPVFGVFFIVCGLWLGPVSAQDCVDSVDSAGLIDAQVEAQDEEQVGVRQVFDGDTVRLRDGRKVRLLGINTPEFNREGGPHEPLAVAARKALSGLIRPADSIEIRHGQQRQDRYKRELAHLIIDERINVQQVLLQRGLAMAIAVPPNLWQQDCYQQAEDQARRQGLGLWALDYYRPLDVGRQRPQQGGFRLIKGRVMNVATTRRSVWLNLEGGMSLRIAREDWQYFPDFPNQDWSQWQGRDIEARGWLYRRGDRWRLRIRHPQNIKKVLSTEY